MFAAIRSVSSLRAAEFKVHEKCQKDYTRVCETTETDTGAEMRESTNSVEEMKVDDTQCNQGDRAKLVLFIQENVLGGSPCISTKTFYRFDGNDKRNRHYVKKIIEKEFGDNIIFVTISVNGPQVTLKAVPHKSGELFHSSNEYVYRKRKKDGHRLASNSRVNDILQVCILLSY